MYRINLYVRDPMQSPPEPVYQHPGVYSSHTSAPNQRRPETQEESLFKWVSLKELIFVCGMQYSRCVDTSSRSIRF